METNVAADAILALGMKSVQNQHSHILERLAELDSAERYCDSFIQGMGKGFSSIHPSLLRLEGFRKKKSLAL